jgi:NUP50 (Nucleoporin 50 kDa)
VFFFIYKLSFQTEFEDLKKMAKRMAGQQINHENWDDTDEPEEAGQFKQVPVNKCNRTVARELGRY